MTSSTGDSCFRSAAKGALPVATAHIIIPADRILQAKKIVTS